MPESKWLPIATAPRDGTRVLGWNGFEISVMSFLRDKTWQWEAAWAYYGHANEYEPGYIAHTGRGFQPLCSLSHWMPLPEAP